MNSKAALLDMIRAQPFFHELRKFRLERGGRGWIRSGRPLLIAALASDPKLAEVGTRPILILTDKPSTANLIADELQFWVESRPVQIFPAPDPLFYEPGAWGPEIRAERIRVLTSLAKRALPGGLKGEAAPLIVAPLRAVMTRTIDRKAFLKATKILRVSQQASPTALARRWRETGYAGGEIVREQGSFSLRGGLLDVWPYTEKSPVRLDFFGDELETMYIFDAATQRNTSRAERLLVPPAREVFTPALADGTFADIETDEFMIPLRNRIQACLLDYLPSNTLIVFDDELRIMDQADDIEEQAERQRGVSVFDHLLPEDFPQPYVSMSELRDRMESFELLNLGARGETEDDNAANFSDFEPAERFGGKLSDMVQAAFQSEAAGVPVTIVSRQSARLQKMIDAALLVEEELKPPVVLNGTLREGFRLIGENGEARAQLWSDQEIFGWERPVPRRKTQRAVETSENGIDEFRPGDWLVHIDYGIGQYAGIVTRSIDGSSKEFLKILYAAGDELYVPVHQADRVTNYIGPDLSEPVPTRLGTTEWLNVRQHVKEKVVEVAEDLIELYAKRQVVDGYAFPEDSPWQQDLEGAFPYFETEDQKKAIDAVKADMERPRPMDRLICGDVGFGKTEVALRAAFKAATAGKQVAILAPTTVLAQQHYETFSQRFAPFPVTVEMLSRFRTASEQRRILADLADGKIDVIIGTHRLVSADVRFKDLGLVVIDEEQRFGVAQKEYLKKLRTKVDVLTMSATPIPRTLYMALTGARDISSITTPPDDRVAVITHVGPYSEKLVRQAILRELERDGQIFYLHNRVQSIYVVKQQLEALVPQARIGVGHGQLPEKELSAVMDAFYRHEIDILLSTSIIESGLDVPNANTLIADHADALGLAQLYQIRGRVGRSTQRAYAYFFRNTKSTPEGIERLDVIAENTQLGAGYSIAMRDLEMRGAGELLGHKQSGAIAAIGFNLYTRMLAQAVRTVKEIRGVEIPDEDIAVTREMGLLFDPITVELPLDIGIPESYVAERTTRIKLYRRIAAVHDSMKLETLRDEFTDRFGPLPEPLGNLFYQIQLKILAERIGLSAVVKEAAAIVLRYPPLPGNVETRGLEDVGPGIRAGKNAYWLTGLDFETDDWREAVLARMERVAKM